MNKYISVNKEGIKALQRTFKVKGKAICERCVKNHGGCTYYNIPEGEFFFDSDSCARAVYSNGAEIYLDKQTGAGTVYGPRGEVVARYDHVTLTQINELKSMAEAL